MFGQDGSFSYDALVQRYNSDLANGLGNLASRTLSMIHQYRGGMVPKSDGDSHIAEALTQTTATALEAYAKFEFSRALDVLWQMITVVDKYIVERAPWVLAKSKSPDAPELLDRTLYSAAEVLRVLCGLIYPVLPDSVAKIWEQLGFTESLDALRVKDLHFGHLPAGQKLREVAPVFPRIEVEAGHRSDARTRGDRSAPGRTDCSGRLRSPRSRPPKPRRRRRATDPSPSTTSSRWTCAWASSSRLPR